MSPESPPPSPAPGAAGMWDNLGPTLRLLRERKGLSQERLAREAGLGKSQLSKYETGSALPGLDTLGRVLTVLGYSPYALFLSLALLDRLPAILREEPGAVSKMVTGLFVATPVPALDQAFEAAFSSLLLLHRSVVQNLGRLPSSGGRLSHETPQG